MTTTLERIKDELKTAMRERDKKKLDTLRLITAAIKQVEVDERIVVEDDRLMVILDKMAKQRKESITQFQAANRDDLVAQEQFELELISCYLPEPLSEEEVAQMIQHTIDDLNATSISDMGKVMAKLKPQLQGRSDMSKVSAVIKSKLS